MNNKLIFFFLFVGSTVGGYLPLLWGGSILSLSSVLWGAVGGGIGIYIGYTIGQRFG
jgi:hypothetical protein